MLILDNLLKLLVSSITKNKQTLYVNLKKMKRIKKRLLRKFLKTR